MKIAYLRKNAHATSTLVYLERYVNEGSRTYSDLSLQSEGDPQYSPREGKGEFAIPCVHVPHEKAVIYLDTPSDTIYSKYIKSDIIIIPVHPEIYQDTSVSNIKELRRYFYTSEVASPAASTRTLITKNNTHFMKLHYPRRVSRFVRHMITSNIQTSVEVSKSLATYKLEKFGYLPETLGVTYGSGPEAWGYIIRELTPRPVGKKNTFLMPFFALYSYDIHKPEESPLLVQIIKYLKAEPLSFMLEYLMKPIIQSWVMCIKKAGFFLEMHGENTMLELSTDLVPQRIIYRDMDVMIDVQTRLEQKLHIDFPESKLIRHNHEQIFSIKYDMFIGHHLFEYLAHILEKFFNIKLVLLQERCREIFHQVFPDAYLYFTNKIFYYSDQLFPDEKFRLIETNKEPTWR